MNIKRHTLLLSGLLLCLLATPGFAQINHNPWVETQGEPNVLLTSVSARWSGVVENQDRTIEAFYPASDTQSAVLLIPSPSCLVCETSSNQEAVVNVSVGFNWAPNGTQDYVRATLTREFDRASPADGTGPVQDNGTLGIKLSAFTGSEEVWIYYWGLYENNAAPKRLAKIKVELSCGAPEGDQQGSVQSAHALGTGLLGGRGSLLLHSKRPLPDDYFPYALARLFDPNEYEVLYDPAVSGGSFVASRAHTAPRLLAPAAPALHLDTPALPANGYFVWVRVNAPTAANSHLWVSLDGLSDDALRDPAPGEWTWVLLRGEALPLPEGVSSLRFKLNGPGFAIDAVALSDDPAFVPEGPMPDLPATGVSHLLQAEAAPFDPTLISRQTEEQTAPGELSVELLNLPSGDYDLWIRVRSAAGAEFSAHWNSQEPGLSAVLPGHADWTWVRLQGLASPSASGNHSLLLRLPSATLDLDTVLLTNDSNLVPDGTTPPPAAPGTLWIEAEAFAPNDGIELLTHEAPSGVSNHAHVRKIRIYSGDSALAFLPGLPANRTVNPEGIRLSLDPVVEGPHILWARVRTPYPGGNSLWISAWTETTAPLRHDIPWHLPPLADTWQWVRFEHPDLHFTGAQPRFLHIGHRVGGVQIDRLIVTTDPAFEPAAPGDTPDGPHTAVEAESLSIFEPFERFTAWKQIRGADTLVDIEIIDPMEGQGYRIHRYPMSADIPFGTGPYNTAALTPYATTTLRNPDPWNSLTGAGSFNQLEIKRSDNNISLYTFNEADGELTLSLGGGLKSLTRQNHLSPDGQLRTVLTTTRGAQNQIISQSAEVHRRHPFGERLVERVRHDGALTLNPDGSLTAAGGTPFRSLLTYHQEGPGGGRPHYQVDDNGNWSINEYDLEGRPGRIIRPFLDAEFDDLANAHIIEYSYSDPGVPKPPEHTVRVTRQIETIRGHETRRSFDIRIHAPGGQLIETRSVTAHQPGAAWDHPANPVTTTHYIPNGQSFAGKVHRVIRHDGTGTVNHYFHDTREHTFLSGNQTLPAVLTLTRSGVLNANQDDVVDGTESTTLRATRSGTTLEQVRTDILTGAELDRVQILDIDPFGRPTLTLHADGTRSSRQYAALDCGCGSDKLVSETARDGITTTYQYDALGRRVTTERLGIVRETTLDANGNVLTETTRDVDNTLSLTTTHEYNLLGRRLSTTAPTGAVSSIEHDDINRITTQTNPDGSVTITESYLDGRTKAVYGTATPTQTYTYGVNPDGSQWTRVTTGDAWQKSTTNVLGQSIRQEQPGADGTTLVSTNTYNNKGQLTQTQSFWSDTSDLHPLTSTYYEYNDLGEQIRSWQDINQNGTLDLAGPDRIQETVTQTFLSAGDYWRESRSHTYNHGSSTPTLLGTSRQRLTGLGTVHPTDPTRGLLVSESVSIDIHGNESISRRYLNRDLQTTWTEQHSPFSTIPATSLTVGGLLLEQTDTAGITTTFDYDALQRRVGVTDPRIGRSSVTYHETNGLLLSSTDAAGNTTTFTHDTTGRQIAVTDPEGNTTHTAYTLRGEVAAQWGATYPVVYEYDDQGRMIHLHTLRDPTHTFTPTVNPSGILTSDITTLTSSFDTTTWLYDDATGLLLKKRHADGHGPAYTYLPDGRLETRSWARTTDGSAGDPLMAAPPIFADTHAHSGNANTNYGGATQLEVKTGGSNWNRQAFLKFDLDGLPAHESIPAGTLTLRVTGIGGESTVNRPIRLVMVADSAWSENTLTWNNKPATGEIIDEVVVTAATVGQNIVFDLGDHLAGHTGGELTLALTQPAGVDGLVVFSSREGAHPPALELTLAQERLTTTYHYDDHTHELLTITYSDNTPTVTNEYDRLGRLTKTTDAFGEKTYTYDPDTLQPASEAWFGADNEINVTLTRTYDNQGRPEGFTLGDDYTVTHAYTPTGRFHSVTHSNNQEPLPQYPITAIYSYIPNSHMLSGYTLGDLTRAVTPENNRNLIDTVANSWDTTLISKFDYTNDDAGRRTNREDTGTAFASTQNNTFGYNARSEVTSATMRNGNSTYNFDQIGNRTSVTTPDEPDPLTYFTNALNQYTSVTFVPSVANPLHDLDGNLTNDGKGTTFEWNAENRMVRIHKGDLTIENTFDGQGRRVRKLVIDDGTPIEDHRFFYDGWNLIFEHDILALTDTKYYVWGLDLSQSLQGAGGVGGLILVRQGTNTWAPTFDANGNISEYINLANGNVDAHLEYDAFGRKIVTTGTAPSNFGFSTKYEDTETGYLYYGFRFYDPQTGRWPNRDPIGERGGVNLYGFVANDGVFQADLLGLRPLKLEFNAFIPKRIGKPASHWNSIHNDVTGTWFDEPGGFRWIVSTDNRTFGGGKSRIFIRGEVNTSDIGSLSNNGANIFTVESDSTVRLRKNDHHIESRTSIPTSNEKVEDVNKCESNVTIRASGAYPFVQGAPSIDIKVTFNLKKTTNGNEVAVTIYGWHNRFPNYEALVNNMVFYEYDTDGKGPGPFNLNRRHNYRSGIILGSSL